MVYASIARRTLFISASNVSSCFGPLKERANKRIRRRAEVRSSAKVGRRVTTDEAHVSTARSLPTHSPATPLPESVERFRSKPTHQGRLRVQRCSRNARTLRSSGEAQHARGLGIRRTAIGVACGCASRSAPANSPRHCELVATDRRGREKPSLFTFFARAAQRGVSELHGCGHSR